MRNRLTVSRRPVQEAQQAGQAGMAARAIKEAQIINY
jgi:hypothetical protein